jgi:zinc protease
MNTGLLRWGGSTTTYPSGRRTSGSPSFPSLICKYLKAAGGLRSAALFCAVVLATALLLVGGRAAVAGANISHFTLDNGLEVVVIPDHRTPVVTHMIWYKVGSADEEAGKTGLAHFLEHLMFKGTEKNPQGRFSQVLATVGGQENAFTTADYTGYFQRIAREYPTA